MQPTRDLVNDMYALEIDTALGAVVEAARLCQRVGASISQEALEKKDRSPVTIADFGSQAIICRSLTRAFPGVPIVAEEESTFLTKPENAHLLGTLVARINEVSPTVRADELLEWIDLGSKQPNPDCFWTLDPIDGTKGFLRGDQYAIALALIVRGELQVAALACPRLPEKDGATGAVFGAVKRAGAFRLPMDLSGSRVPIRVSDEDRPQSIRFVESVESAHTSHELSGRIAARLGTGVVPARMDSQAKYASIARGDQDAYMSLQPCFIHLENIWDHAAGSLVVTEAGGRVTDIRGEPFDFRQGKTLAKNCGVVVTNGRIHDAVLEALKAQRSCCRL